MSKQTDRSIPEGITPAQTVGPFFAYCLTPTRYGRECLSSGNLATEDASGVRIRIEGKIFDGVGNPIPDAMIEVWQPDGEGQFSNADRALSNTSFTGFGRVECEEDGGFHLTTVKPGRVPGPAGALQAPHINITIFAKGLVRHLFTRIYFDDEASNQSDPILGLLPPDLQATLIARSDPDACEPVYRLDIRLQGENETVFFDA